jgi:hypothetical protein
MKENLPRSEFGTSSDKILEKWQEMEDDHFNLVAQDPASWDVDRQYDTRWDETFFGIGCKAYFLAWQQGFATFPMSILLETFNAKGDTLSEIVQKYARRYQHEFLDEALDDCSYDSLYDTPEYQQHVADLENRIKVQFQGNAQDKANQAWLWAHENKPCELYVGERSEFPIGEGLRRFGYVFWDSDRLQNCEFFQKKSASSVHTLETLLTMNRGDEVSGIILKKFPRPVYNEDSWKPG